MKAAETIAPRLPGSAEPGQIEQRFKPPLQPKVTPQIPAPTIEPGKIPRGAKDIRFVLSSLDIKGVTVYKPADLAPIYEKYLGKEISLADIYLISAEITARYRKDGYILSQAVVPAQRIREGRVQIFVVEGFVDRIIIEGDVKGPRSLLESYGSKIAAAKPLTAYALERYLLLANDLPGVSVRAVLKPSPVTPGASDLILRVSHKLFGGYFSSDNRGSRSVGPFQIELGATTNSLLNFYERTSGRVIIATQLEELVFGELSHEIPIGSEGVQLRSVLSASHSEPGFDLKPFEIESDSFTGQIQLLYPFLRSRRRNLFFDLSFVYRDIETDLLGQSFTKDRLRVFRFGVTYDWFDEFIGPLSINIVRVELSQGIEGLGASKSGSERLSRAQGRSDFTKVWFEASRLQKIVGAFQILLGVSGQFAEAPLLASEEFGLGGSTYGRAYDPSELTGDHGIAGRIEAQLGVRFLPEFFKSFQIFTFYDVGAVWNIDNDATIPKRQSLASAGAGFRFSISKLLSGSFEVANPLTRPVTTRGSSGEKARFFFSLRGSF